MKNQWVEPDIRDNVVETVPSYKERTKIPVKDLISFAGISSGKFYDWQKRYGIPNKHNGRVPISSWLLDWEKECIYTKKQEQSRQRLPSTRSSSRGMAYRYILCKCSWQFYITHHELRAYMQEEDVTVVLQRAYEKFSGVNPRIISDRGSQFIHILQ